MFLELWRFSRELAAALLRVLFAEREGPHGSPRVELVVPDGDAAHAARSALASGPAVVLSDLLEALREDSAFRTAEELAVALRRRGAGAADASVSAQGVRELIRGEGARFVEVRLRSSALGKVAEFRARPMA